MHLRRKSPHTLFVAFILLAFALTGCAAVVLPGGGVLLLVPNYGEGAIEVLTPSDLVAGGNASRSWYTEIGNGFDGLAMGPDGRLYVSDYSNDAIVVIDGADMDGNGMITPAAVITHPDLAGPIGASFDSNGHLWVASYSDSTVLRFDDVLGATGSVTRAPALVLSVYTGGGLTGFNAIYDVFVDHLDNVWVADNFTGVYRFNAVAGLTGTETRVPGLHLATGTASATSSSGYTLFGPMSLIVDEDGTLYVGNEQYNVSRFDGAVALTGTPTPEASAYLNTGYDEPFMVALDGGGSLWIAHLTGELVELPTPASYTGNVDVSGDLALDLSWVSTPNAPDPDGGNMKFVPR